jgi:hypothetical protein
VSYLYIPTYQTRFLQSFQAASSPLMLPSYEITNNSPPHQIAFWNRTETAFAHSCLDPTCRVETPLRCFKQTCNHFWKWQGWLLSLPHISSSRVPCTRGGRLSQVCSTARFVI